jgi:hypothetical protein
MMLSMNAPPATPVGPCDMSKNGPEVCGPGQSYGFTLTSDAWGKNRPCWYCIRKTPDSMPHLQPRMMRGLGLFDSTDFQDWGIAEWFVLLAAAYTLFSLFRGTRRAAGRVRSTFSKRRRKSERRRDLKRQLTEA